MKAYKKLFPDEFRTVKSYEDLMSLCDEFPDFDPGYVFQSQSTTRRKTKKWLEELWAQYYPYADINFLDQFKRHFTQRCWELYLGTTFLNRGFNLIEHKTEGPDFGLKTSDLKQIVWVEAIAVTKGDGKDKVPEMVCNGIQDVPSEQILLRLANALEVKQKVHTNYLQKEIINMDDPFVIAIDRSSCEHLDPDMPLIIKALFGIGHLALTIRVGEKPVSDPKPHWTRMPNLSKKNGIEIPMLFFEDTKNNGISAVIYTKDHVINSPRNSKEMGENFVIVHNPNAKTPLPQGFFPFGDEYVAGDQFIEKIKNHSDYQEPDIFDYLED